MSIFDRYTDQAKIAIFLSRVEALHRDEKSIGVGDILLALTWDETSRACQVAGLKQLAVELRGLLRIPHLPSSSLPYRRDVDIPLSQELKKVLAYAVEEADRAREYWIDTDHLLEGLLRFDNVAGDVLKGLGIQLQPLRLESKENRKQYPPNEVSKRRLLAAFITKYRSAVNILLLLAILLALILVVKIRGPAK
jgi:ATP-dependent Clp protease ATP-binding subunit ClpC